MNSDKAAPEVKSLFGCKTADNVKFAGFPDMRKYLVIGATGHVGSQVTIGLANAGYNVTALVRKSNSVLQDPHQGSIRYVQGDLNHSASMRRAVRGTEDM